MGRLATLLIVVTFWAVLVVGWWLNIWKLIEATSIGTLEIVRIIGIFLAPVGVLVGYFV